MELQYKNQGLFRLQREGRTRKGGGRPGEIVRI